MTLEMARISTCITALAALVRFCSSMSADVICETDGSSTGIAALTELERLFSSVSANVPFESAYVLLSTGTPVWVRRCTVRWFDVALA